MTKELVISVIIVVVIIAGDIFTTKYTNKSIEIATQSLSEIRKEMEKENEEDINKDKLKEQIKEIRDDWNEKHKKLAIYIEHDELEKIETNLASLNGYLDILKADGTVGDRASASAYNAIKTVYNKLDPAIVMKEDTVIFVGEDDYRAFIQDLVAANLFHFAPDYKDGEYVLPGTSVRVIAVAGLTGTSAVIGGQLSNFFYGVDAADDAQTLDVWYSKDAREFRIAAGFSMAAQIARPDMVAAVKNN